MCYWSLNVFFLDIRLCNAPKMTPLLYVDLMRSAHAFSHGLCTPTFPLKLQSKILCEKSAPQGKSFPAAHSVATHFTTRWWSFKESDFSVMSRLHQLWIDSSLCKASVAVVWWPAASLLKYPRGGPPANTLPFFFLHLKGNI